MKDITTQFSNYVKFFEFSRLLTENQYLIKETNLVDTNQISLELR